MDFISDNEKHRIVIIYKDFFRKSAFLFHMLGNLAKNNRNYKQLNFFELNGESNDYPLDEE